MRGQRDDLIGVFEAINHKGNGFQDHDTTVLNDLATHAAVAIQSLKTRKKLLETCDRLVEDAASASPLIGEHSSVNKIRKTAAKVAKTDLTVLVLGQNGTGKEVLARHIHFESERRNALLSLSTVLLSLNHFWKVNCLVTKKRAFTDANQTRQEGLNLPPVELCFLMKWVI